MLVFQRQRESVDNASKDFQKLSNAVVSLCFINKAVKDVADGLFDNAYNAVKLPRIDAPF